MMGDGGIQRDRGSGNMTVISGGDRGERCLAPLAETALSQRAARLATFAKKALQEFGALIRQRALFPDDAMVVELAFQIRALAADHTGTGFAGGKHQSLHPRVNNRAHAHGEGLCGYKTFSSALEPKSATTNLLA